MDFAKRLGGGVALGIIYGVPGKRLEVERADDDDNATDGDFSQILWCGSVGWCSRMPYLGTYGRSSSAEPDTWSLVVNQWVVL